MTEAEAVQVVAAFVLSQALVGWEDYGDITDTAWDAVEAAVGAAAPPPAPEAVQAAYAALRHRQEAVA